MPSCRPACLELTIPSSATVARCCRTDDPQAQALHRRAAWPMLGLWPIGDSKLRPDASVDTSRVDSGSKMQTFSTCMQSCRHALSRSCPFGQSTFLKNHRFVVSFEPPNRHSGKTTAWPATNLNTNAMPWIRAVMSFVGAVGGTGLSSMYIDTLLRVVRSLHDFYAEAVRLHDC